MYTPERGSRLAPPEPKPYALGAAWPAVAWASGRQVVNSCGRLSSRRPPLRSRATFSLRQEEQRYYPVLLNMFVLLR